MRAQMQDAIDLKNAAEKSLESAQEKMNLSNTQLDEKIAEIERLNSKVSNAEDNSEKQNSELSEIKDEIKRIAARNSDLEKSNEDLKLDLIKQKSDLTEKFDKAKDDLVSLAKDLELSLENQQKQTENAEALGKFKRLYNYKC